MKPCAIPRGSCTTCRRWCWGVWRMSKYDELQAGHQRLLELREQAGDPAALLQAAQAYIEQVKTGAQDVPDLRDRSQLRANLRFWAAFVFEQTKNYPDTTLLPYNRPPAPQTGPAGAAAAAAQAAPPPQDRDFSVHPAGPVAPEIGE